MDLTEIKKRAAKRYGVPEPKPCKCGIRYHITEEDDGFCWIPSCNCKGNKKSIIFAYEGDQFCKCPNCNKTSDCHNDIACEFRLVSPKYWTSIIGPTLMITLKMNVLLYQ